MRCIFHIDLDAFFASVEIIKNPDLRGKPVIVGGRPDRRGVVSTCSYEARKYGVRSAMPVKEAYRLCPQGIFLEGDFSAYREFSNKVFEVIYQFTPYVEVVSIDEAYLDVTASLNDRVTPKDLALSIHSQIFNSTKLTCSIGIAANKLVAKIAAGKAKPNGIFEVLPGTEETFLAPMPIQALPGIGEKTKVILNREGFNTVADMQKIPIDQLVNEHGAWGYYYYYACRGEDNRPVDWEFHLPKSIGAETTFEKDLSQLPLLMEEMKELIQKAHKRMRKHKMRTKRINLKLRYSDFTTISRSLTLPSHINEFDEIQEAVLGLFLQHYPGHPPLRLIGMSLEQLTDSYWQPTLF